MARPRPALPLLLCAAIASAERPPYGAPTERPSSVTSGGSGGGASSANKPQKRKKIKKKKKKKKNEVDDHRAQRGQRQQHRHHTPGRPQQGYGQCTTPGSCDQRQQQQQQHYGGLPPPEEEQHRDPYLGFEEYLSSVESWEPRDMQEGLLEISGTGSITTPMQRHLERVAVRRAFREAHADTLERTGKYADGSPAGSPQWIGDFGVQNPRSPQYASLGSILDVSTLYSTAWEGSTEFGGKPSWISSLIHRREIVMHDEHLPCRTDLLDDYDPADNDDSACFLGLEAEDYVAVRGNDEKKYGHWELAAEWAIGHKGKFVKSTVMELELTNEDGSAQKFDTIVANGALASKEGMHDLDLILERLVSFLKPGGVIYLVGIEPIKRVKGPGRVFNDILDAIDSVKALTGEYPHVNVPATWINRNLHRLGLDVFSSTVFPTKPTFDDMSETVNEAMRWIEENQPSGAVRKQYTKMLSDLMDKARGATRAGPVFAGERQYIIAAELPVDGNARTPLVKEPTVYAPKPRYSRDKEPKVEKLDETPVLPGEMAIHKWGNGDPYDGLGARVALPPQLVPTITRYVKDLGLWDMMIDTVQNDPMPQDSTRFFNVTSPYGGEGRNFSWSAKRPDNFYGSASDMHWFDIADEAAHEDSIRALAEGGFDEVLKAIGEYLGLDHLVSFSIGLLAVTKADKGYVHVDFHDSGRRAFNFLINLETPGDEPELTVIEEDAMGNFRRAQVKYEPTFGVLNGDGGMHATNECDHRASGGVRLTASIFISDLKEASLEEVAEHDNYYFPFGNMDWIWAQRGRHWNKEDGGVSLANDKGRLPFEPEDNLEDCATRVGKNKVKCWVNSIERKRCYKTCGFFMSDDEFRPGVDRQKVFGW